MVLSEGERKIAENLERKKQQVQRMFQSLVAHMQDSMHLVSSDYFPEQERTPQWL
jgi:hypothetical protein